MFIEINGCTFYRSSDGGNNWDDVLTQYHGCDLEFDADGKTQYLRTSFLLRSSDLGSNWESLLFPQQGNPNVIPHPNQAGEIFVLYDNPPPWEGYLSLDRGTTWKKMEGNVSFWNGRIFSSHNNPDILYNISGSFLDPIRSDDGGKSWKSCLRELNIGVYVTQSDTRAIIDPLDINHLAVATQGTGILVSRDGCTTWQSSNAGLGSLYVNTIAINPKNSDTLYAGTDGGAYVSFNGGENWVAINDGLLGATVVYSIVVDKDSNVYAATPYGIFRLEQK